MLPTARRRRAAIAGGVLAYASVAALCRPLTDPALVAVLVAGLPLCWWGVRRAPGPVRPVGGRSVAVWLGLGVVAGGFELALRLGPNDVAHPTLSTLADPVLGTYPGRVAGYVLWLAAGLWLVRR